MRSRAGLRTVNRGAALKLMWLAATAAAVTVAASVTAPPAVKQPGTQPTEVNSFASNCDTCHASNNSVTVEITHDWQGGMMAQAVRDGLFWATVAVAEQDFLPNADPEQRGGAGDLCLRCHGPGGWLSGLSEPTDGGLYTANEARGVECEFCHLLVDPDQTLNVADTIEVQSPPFEAFDPASGDGYYGSGQYVINGGGTRLGPYADPVANHPTLPSPFHRQGELCGTCHDVSNPVTGDLAHNNGAQFPLPEGSSSGDLASPVEQKAQFLNPPASYGVVERTFSEWKASALDTWSVNDFPLLPEELRIAGGALAAAYHRAYDSTGDADYADGAPRFFTCQTCHMAASSGHGCNKTNVPARPDLPRHDQTGGGYWMPSVVIYQDDRGTLVMGEGLDQAQRAALSDAASRATAQLTSAASLSAAQEGGQLQVKVTNLTGHKLISGYPEGRRMWLELTWFDATNELLKVDGAYGPIGRTVDDLDGTPHQVESLLDPTSTVVFEVRPGIDQAWAAQLIGLGYPEELVLAFDRLDDSALHTLGELAAADAEAAVHSFRFVLNNTILADNRIPPFGFDRNQAAARNALPVPASQFGDPAPGESYDHWSSSGFPVPPSAARVEVRLKYQQTSWEYVQFLWLANDGLSARLGDAGVDMLDAWANTGMSPPVEMAAAELAVNAAAGEIFSDGFETGDTSAWSDASPPGFRE